MPEARKFCISVLLAVFFVGILILTSGVGGFLNRGRGGFIYFGGPRNESDSDYYAWYWSRHILNTAYVAIPTGVLVLLLGLHWKAALAVALMTWFSLYVKWDSYVNIGMVDNIHSRAGYLDWLIGRQGKNWTVNQRFIREYAGLSLQGLIWTAPQGYLLEYLGFGWEFSLSGSLMGMAYYVGSQFNLTRLKSTFLNNNVALSEFLWGWFIWFVLSIVALSQLVRRARCRIHKRNPYLGFKPYSQWEVIKYESLNRIPFRVVYELFMVVLNLLYCCSVTFYELVEQRDLSNKGQIFFGLFMAVLCLTFVQGWSWGGRYLRWQLRRISKSMKRFSGRAATVTGTSPTRQPGSSTPRANLRGGQLTRSRNKNNDSLQKSNAINRANKEYTTSVLDENEPLLAWPYSHPDRLSPIGDSPASSGGNNRLQLPEGDIEHGMIPSSYNVQEASTSTALLILWQKIEKWIWMDMFVWIRRLLGIISLMNVMLLVVLVFIATAQGWNNARFMQECGNNNSNMMKGTLQSKMHPS